MASLGCSERFTVCEDCDFPDASGGTESSGGSGATDGDGGGGLGGQSTGGTDASGGTTTGGTTSGGGSDSGGGTGGSEPDPCDACTGDTPVCVDDECVACTEDDAGSCTDTELCTPEHECVPCMGEETPGCAEGEVCTEDNECVTCTETTHCTDPAASVCMDENECTACVENDDCAHVEGLNVCDAGECVECTATDYAACGLDTGGTGKPLLCDALTNTCSTTESEGSSGLCQSCISNAQCQTGQVCVLQSFGEAPTSEEVGYFCFWEKGAGGGAPTSCGGEGRPYVNTMESTETIDGSEATICGLAVTTCPALGDFRNVDCAPEGTPDDSLCGAPDLSDGYCRLFDADPDIYRCTVACLSTDDCKTGVAACSGGTPDVCDL